MNKLQQLAFSYDLCRKEVLELQKLLKRMKTLKERNDILPFFKKHLHLSAFIGSYIPGIVTYDRIEHEFDISGSFKCDVVVGDSIRKQYAFIEFEDASPSSIFTKTKKKTPEWARRFEHGFSQLVDWFFRLDDLRDTTDFVNAFGDREIEYAGLLVLGRDEAMEDREKRRLIWRKKYVQIHAKTIHCVTFDQLCKDLLEKLDVLELIKKTP